MGIKTDIKIIVAKLNDLESLAHRIHLLCGSSEMAERHHLGALYQLAKSDGTRAYAMRIRTTAWQLSLRCHWGKVNQAFQEAEVPVVLLKGLRWADSLFLSPWFRSTTDLDILVQAEDIGRASRLLKGIGARPDDSTISAEQAVEEHFHFHSHFRFEDVDPSVSVELHWQITYHGDIQLTDQALWANIEQTPDGYVMNYELDLLLACVHTYRHGYIPYRTLVDVERMVALRSEQIHWDRFWNLASQARATQAVAFVLLLSSRHLAFDLPPGADRLTSLQRRWFSFAAVLLSPQILLKYPRYYALYESYTALVTGTWPTLDRLVRLAFRPHPEALASAYGIDPTDRRQVRRAYLLRPFRLLWKYITPAQER